MLKAMKSFTLVDNFSETLIVGFGVVLLFACAQISIPLEPVPISLQSVGVMLLAITYNKVNALRAISLYILLGALGVPMFANFSSGIGVILGPTGGYIVGFVVSVYVMNIMKPTLKPDSWIGIFLNCLVGTIVIYIFGLAWLSCYIGFKNAIQVGLFPFIVPGLMKAILLTMLLKSIGYLRIGKVG